MDPAAYERWYHSARGRWIAEREYALLERLLGPRPGERLLDVGCGTGHFSRRFAQAGLAVTGIDPDAAALAYAGGLGGGVRYVRGAAERLPFPDASFDRSIAVTSLCFVARPAAAVREMLRVTRGPVVLGLLNRRSLLYRRKRGRGGYRGARWDTVEGARRWLPAADPRLELHWRSAVFLPGGGTLARLIERLVPERVLLGAFLAVRVTRRGSVAPCGRA